MFEKRISIFTGHFGSGKTEVAVNYTFELASRGYKTAVVDFDIVNPFFRTADAKLRLENKGIRVITPMYANTNVDVPALPAEINTLFEEKDYKVVFDVGGDDLGARVLSRYNEDIVKDDYELFFVINTRRPMTDTAQKITEMIGEIENSARLKVTSLVNNTNLLGATSAQDILEGGTLIKTVSEKTGIPVGFTSGLSYLMDELKTKTGGELLRLDKYIALPWE